MSPVEAPVSPTLQEWGWKLSSIFCDHTSITPEITAAVTGDIGRATQEIIHSFSSPTHHTQDQLANFLELLTSTQYILPQSQERTYTAASASLQAALDQLQHTPVDQPGPVYILLQAAHTLTDWTADHGTPGWLSGSLLQVSYHLVDPQVHPHQKASLLEHFRAPHYIVRLAANAIELLAAHQNNLQNRQATLQILLDTARDFIPQSILPFEAKSFHDTLISVLFVFSNSPELLTPTTARAIIESNSIEKLFDACSPPRH